MSAVLADWLDPLYDAEQMRAIDRWAIEERGIPSLDLMERAGAGLALHGRPARAARARSRSSAARATTAATGSSPGGCCGEMGRTVRVLTLAAARGVPRATRRRTCAGSRAATSRSTRRALDDAAVIVDAIFGTGFDGEPRGAAKDAIEAIAVLDAPVVSADVASGVDASTGRGGARVASHATLTATFAAAKPGHWIAPGKQHTGELHVDRHRHPAGRAGRGPTSGC